MVDVEYLSACETGAKLGYGTETIRTWCRTGRVRGAIKPFGKGEWRIPVNWTPPPMNQAIRKPPKKGR